MNTPSVPGRTGTGWPVSNQPVPSQPTFPAHAAVPAQSGHEAAASAPGKAATSTEKSSADTPPSEVRSAKRREKSEVNRGNAILSSMLGVQPEQIAHLTQGMPQQLQQAASAAPAGPADLSALTGMDETVVARLVESILVSASDGTEGEVRIRIHDEVLQDTSIVLRVKDGALQVHLHTANEHSALILHQNVDALRQNLAHGRPGETVEVRILETPDSPQAGGQHPGGHQHGDRQRDERSRGLYVWDQDDEKS